MPVILVGPGTGIAPFRSFWQERIYDIRNGENTTPEMVLYFGCRNSLMDDIYMKDTKEAQLIGALTDVHTAYSRDKDQPKVKVFSSYSFHWFLFAYKICTHFYLSTLREQTFAEETFASGKIREIF